MESFEKRLKRFVNENVEEIPLTLINSILNFILPQIEQANEHKHYELMLLGTHAIIQIVSENVFGRRGNIATKFYLENFVDGATKDTKFSLVSEVIHGWRNNIAHQWLSHRGHKLLPDSEMKEGWKYENNLLKLNPRIYGELFIKGYKTRGIFKKYRQLLTNPEKLIRKYEYIANWLDIRKKSDPIYQEITKLKLCTSSKNIQSQEGIIKNLIYRKYKIGGSYGKLRRQD
ncbi:MAG: hypothetical protein P9M08_12885 [Candidatus Erginobacter occultus]|nr:hypothetical protein [Candidatus Erginobacter occultus]